MRAVLLLAILTLSGASSRAAPPPVWEPPAGAKVYKEATATFTPGNKPLKVIFYYEMMKRVAVSVLTSDGRELAGASFEVNLGLEAPTGLYHLKGDRSFQVVLVGRGGAKVIVVRVYEVGDGRLRQIFEWSGWSFRILELDGRPGIAANGLEHGSLTDLYLWEQGGFQKVNQRFPQFYAPEIERQEKFIREADGPFAGWFAEACRLAAQALLYSKRYAEASGLCQEALVAIHSRCCSGASVSPPEVVSADRKQAEEEIRHAIELIEEAKARARTDLSR